MHRQPYPIRQQTPTPPATPCPALHLLNGRWVASCPACGYQLASARSQARAEQRGRRRRCPVCTEVA
jgi:hypothetical protein